MMNLKSATFPLLCIFQLNIIGLISKCTDVVQTEQRCNNYCRTFNYLYRTCTYRMIYNPHNYSINENFEYNNYDKVTIEADIVSSLISNLRYETFTGTDRIRNLTINSSQIQEIDADAFKNFVKLKTLHLSNNSISVLKNHTFSSLHQLEILNISNNKIRNIEIEAFADLSSIEIIDLSVNKIFTVEGVFEQLVSLKKLDLSHNKLTSLDTNFSPTLVALNVGNNEIRTIPEGAFAKSRELHELNLANNAISNLSNAFANSALNSLNLRNNSITKISIEAFKNLTNLLQLDLCMNNISSLDVGVFSGVTHLYTLDLSVNMLTAISTNTFVGLHTLTSLNISHNKITSVAGYPFHNIPFISNLDISFNGLTNFNLQELTELRFLNIEGNHFKCSTLSKLLRSLKSRDVVVERGNVLEKTGIYGIACEDFDDPSNTSTADAKEVLEKYFQEDFKQSNFIKFLQNNRDVKMDDDYLEELMKAMMAYEKQSLDNSKNFHNSIVNKLSSILTTNILLILLFAAIITLFIVTNFNKIKFAKLLEKKAGSTNELESIM